MPTRSSLTAAIAAVLAMSALSACGSDEPSADSTATNPATTPPSTSTPSSTTVPPDTAAPLDTVAADSSVAAATTPPTTTTETTTTTPVAPPVFDFATAERSDGWRVVNDTVMGGVSNGELSWSDGELSFVGELSLDNNGGFASIRSPEIDPPTATEWAGRAGVRVEVGGDGRTWTLEVRSNDESGGWIRSFPTLPDGPTTVELPWDSFEPVTRFLEPRSTNDALDPARIATVAFYLVDGIEGPFRLDLRSIG